MKNYKAVPNFIFVSRLFFNQKLTLPPQTPNPVYFIGTNQNMKRFFRFFSLPRMRNKNKNWNGLREYQNFDIFGVLEFYCRVTKSFSRVLRTCRIMKYCQDTHGTRGNSAQGGQLYPNCKHVGLQKHRKGFLGQIFFNVPLPFVN